MMSPQTWQITVSRSTTRERRGRRLAGGTVFERQVTRRRLLDRRFLHARKRGLLALVDREHTHRLTLVVVEVLDGESPEDVVDQAGGKPDVGIVGHARRLEAHVGEHVHERLEGHAVLEAVAHRDGEGVHDSRQCGALLGDLQEDLAGATVFELSDGDIAVAVGDPERERLGVAALRKLLANRFLDDDRLDDPLDSTLDDTADRALGVTCRTFAELSAGLLLCRQRLTHLAVVAVDRHRLQSQAPSVEVELLDVFDRDLLGNVYGLRDRARDEGLHRSHHRDVAAVVDRIVAHRAGEHRQVLGVEAGGADDRLVVVDVPDDLVDLFVGVSEAPQRAGSCG